MTSHTQKIGKIMESKVKMSLYIAKSKKYLESTSI